MKPPSEAEQRQRIVTIAHSWLGTPYHCQGRVKGVGVDCLTVLAEVFAEAKLIASVEIPHYPQDFMLHRDTERYLTGLLHYAAEIDGPPQPGDIALWKFGRCFSHGAIVVAWPVIIHAYVGRGCVIEDASSASYLAMAGKAERPVKFFSYWSR